VRGDDDDARVIPDPQADHVQPIFYLTLLDAAARLPDQQVERTAAEEELVRDAVDVLPAEIPGVELDFDAVFILGVATSNHEYQSQPHASLVHLSSALRPLFRPFNALSSVVLPTLPSPTSTSLAS
jgi:hypothetical protein